jgi:hypothetical protein
MTVRIIYINKDNGNHYNPHEAIVYLGWMNESTGQKGKSSRLEMVKFIQDGNIAYVMDGYGNKAYLYVRTSVLGNKYVQTYADGKPTDNLLELPECR